MEYILTGLLASYELYSTLAAVCVFLSIACALFVTIVVMMQPGNSNGVSALTGSSDTFYGKNKSKTVESKLRTLTVICIAVMAVFMVAFYLLQMLMEVAA